MADYEARNEQVRQIIVDALGRDADTVTPQSLLEKDLGADSLDCVEITMLMEDTFGIKIDDAEASKAKTVNDWQTLIGSKTA